MKHVINYARKGFVNEEILLDWNEIAKEHGNYNHKLSEFQTTQSHILF